MGSALSSIFGGPPKQSGPSAAQLEAQRRLEEEQRLAERQEEEKRAKEKEAAAFKDRESRRLRQMAGMGSTIKTSGSGLTEPAELQRATLKTKLGQ